MLLEDVIEALEADGEHYAKASLTFSVGDAEPLYAKLREQLPELPEPPELREQLPELREPVRDGEPADRKTKGGSTHE